MDIKSLSKINIVYTKKYNSAFSFYKNESMFVKSEIIMILSEPAHPL